MEEYLKNELVKELLNVAKKMKEEKDIIKKVYYYSAAFGIVDRTMRYEFSKDLLMTSTILNLTYQSYIERIKSLSSGDRTIPLSPEQLDKTSALIDGLAKAFKKGGEVDDILKDITLLSYMSTGPGHYMSLNGAFDGLV